MPKRQSRSLSRESREARLAEVRKQLSAFLERLDPLIRRTILERDTLTFQELQVVSFDRQSECSAAQQEYERLAILLPNEWRQYTRRVGPGRARLAQLRLLGHARKPGAPPKAADPTEHELIVKLVAEATVRLGEGWALWRARKKAGGSESDNEAIRPAIKALGYDLVEQSAILNTKTLQGAAVLLVARQTNKDPRTIRSSIRRARLNAPSK